MMIGSRKRSTLLSGLLHAGAIAAIVLATGVKNPPVKVTHSTMLVAPDLAPYRPALPRKSEGGGGGGARDDTPASRGRLPKFKLRQFTPPVAVIRNFRPELSIEPSLIGDPTLVLPSPNLPQFGDPNGVAGPPSGGRGTRGGIGDGDGGGVGNRRGPGYGQGGDDGGVSGVAANRGSLTRPVVLWKIEPEYSEEARKAHLQGVVLLHIEVGTDGRARNIRVRNSLGLGLDEKAIEAVKRWKFRPGSVDGRLVVTEVYVELSFRLL